MTHLVRFALNEYIVPLLYAILLYIKNVSHYVVLLHLHGVWSHRILINKYIKIDLQGMGYSK